MALDSFQTELLMWALSPLRPTGVASRETKCPKNKQKKCDGGEIRLHTYLSILIVVTNLFRPLGCGHMGAVCSSQTQHLASNHNYQLGSSSSRSNHSQRNRKSHSPFRPCHRHSHLWSHSSVLRHNSHLYHMAGILEDKSLEKKHQLIGKLGWNLIDQIWAKR